MTSRAFEFDPETVAAVARYMNDEQAHSLATIASAAHPNIEVLSATVTHFDGSAVEITAATMHGDLPIHIPWPTPITQRYQVRGSFVALLENALDIASR